MKKSYLVLSLFLLFFINSCGPGLNRQEEVATISTLVIKDNVSYERTLTPAFSTSVTSYTLDLDFGVSKLSVIPTFNKANSITVNSTSTSSGSTSSVSLSAGSNTLTVVIDGKTYTITVNRSTTPIRPTSSGLGSNRILAAKFHSAVVKSDGTVYAWGTNSSGQLGNNSTVNSGSAVQVQTATGFLTDIVAIAGDTSHNVAVDSSGNVYAWGLGTSGQIGNGANSTVLVATQVKVDATTNLTGVANVQAGATFSIALKTDGTVWAWGGNTYGQIGQGSTATATYNYAQQVQTSTGALTNIVSIKCGIFHCLALKNDGTVYGWGKNSTMAAGDGTTTASAQSYAVQVTGLSNIIAIAAGGGSGVEHSAAVTTSGNVYTWGSNSYWMLGHGTTGTANSPDFATDGSSNLTNISKVSASYSDFIFINSSGQAFTTGDDSYGLRGDGGTTNSLSSCSTTVTSECYLTQVLMNDNSSLSKVLTVVTGYDHAFAITHSGNIIGWGRNDTYQLINNSTTPYAGAISISWP